MALRKLAKDQDSGKHGCPTVYVDEDQRVGVDQVLVLQGDIVVEGEPAPAGPPDAAQARCVWLQDDTVLALGDRLPHARVPELENVLAGEAAIPLLAGCLFGETVRGRAEDLGLPGSGQVLVSIKAATVQAARRRYHADSL